MTDQNVAGLPVFNAVEREQQRITHLVLGAPRPRRKLTSKRKKTKAPVIRLAPGIEERVQLREDWSHKQGTPETHARAAAAAMIDGTLGRLQRSGAIDAHQAAAAELIVAAHERITADVAVRTAKLEPRGSGGGANAAAAERIAAVVLERRYTDWRARVEPFAAMMLAIIVDGMALGKVRIAGEWTRKLFPVVGARTPEFFVWWDDDFLLSGDSKAIAAYLRAGLGGNQLPGWLSQNEARRKVNLPPKNGPGGDDVYSPTPGAAAPAPSGDPALDAALADDKDTADAS